MLSALRRAHRATATQPASGMQRFSVTCDDGDGKRRAPLFLRHCQVAHDIGVPQAGVQHGPQVLAAGYGVARIAEELGAIRYWQAYRRLPHALWRALQPE